MYVFLFSFIERNSFSSVVPCLRDNRDSSPGGGQDVIFSLRLRLQSGSRPTQPPIEWVPRVIFSRGKVASRWSWPLISI